MSIESRATVLREQEESDHRRGQEHGELRLSAKRPRSCIALE